MVKSIKEALNFGFLKLKENNIDSALIDTYVLLCHILKCDKGYLTVHNNEPISEVALSEFENLIEKRAKKMPVKYLTGICEFYSLEFMVDKNVLIPRPDTEIIIDTALNEIDRNKDIKILDLCSGSGCIGITLATLYKNSQVTLVEVSDGAISISQKNIIKHNLDDRIKIVKRDILSESLQGTFDLIVSNPPYINEDDYKKLDEDVKNYEPELALVSHGDEYKFYKRIIDSFSKNLADNGIILLEIGYNQSEYLSEYAFNSHIFSDISVVKDLSGINRVLCLKK
ncbi:MAG: peptide chain release factor N(5)-glutamine methyltransferase [Ruminococcaceae bacterium]|nr:peptide chain release factor N(5)-glutamine methyltransferase [Oscillospiraceae bacterium]